MISVTDPHFWFKTPKQVENAQRRISSADWPLFTARPHDPAFYPTLASATHCGWHGKVCGTGSVWAVMVPLRSANRVGMCSLGVLEAEGNYTKRAREVDSTLDVTFTFEGDGDVETAWIIAQSIVKLHDEHNMSWLALAEIFGIDQQRVRRLYDRIEGPEAHRVYAAA